MNPALQWHRDHCIIWSAANLRAVSDEPPDLDYDSLRHDSFLACKPAPYFNIDLSRDDLAESPLVFLERASYDRLLYDRLLARRPPYANIDLSGDDVTVESPIVFLESDREDYNIVPTYHDPLDDNILIPAVFAIRKFAGFLTLLLSTKQSDGVRRNDYAFQLLIRAVKDKRAATNAAGAVNFVKRLHSAGWTAGCYMGAALLTAARSESQDSLDRLSDDDSFLKQQIRLVRSYIDDAKTSSASLSEWHERIFQLHPDLLELKWLLRSSSLPYADQWFRFFDEVDADISALLVPLTGSALTALNAFGDIPPLFPVPTWGESLLDSPDYKELEKTLDYMLHARTLIPKFWRDKALQYYRAGSVSRSVIDIDYVEPYGFFALGILESADSAWWHGRQTAGQAEIDS